MQEWARLVESLATVGVIVTALCLMLGIVELGYVLKHIGAILGIAILLILVPIMMVSAWAAMSIWQKIGFAAICLAVLLFRRPRPHTGRTREK